MSDEQSVTPKIIFDTDANDVLGLLLLLASSEAELALITVTFGNTELKYAYTNVLKVYQLVLDHLGRYPNDRSRFPNLKSRPRLCPGAAGPLSGVPHLAKYFHGPDGLSDLSTTHPEFDVRDPSTLSEVLQESKASAEDAIIELLLDNPEDSVTVVAVGPLTNIARAWLKNPQALQRVRRFVVMGGTLDAPGNTSATAEFNFFADPEAATVVMDAAKSGAINLYLAPLDLTTQHGVPYTHLIHPKLLGGPLVNGAELAQTMSPLRAFTSAFLHRVRRVTQELGRPDVFDMHDPLAVWAGLVHAKLPRDTPLVEGWEAERRDFVIECQGQYTKGMCVVDRRGGTDKTGGVRSEDGVQGTDKANSRPVVGVKVLTLTPGPEAKGPISVSHYMQMCLSHPTEGYYMKGEPIGAQGDFITSPEISQLFGELLGIWLVSQWLERGQNRPIRVVELGPGRGTLMDDILRTFGSIGQTRGRVQAVHLVETSAKLQEEQKNRLGARISEASLHWHDRVEDIPENPDAFTLLVAHEFFDAIPINIIEKTAIGFQEVLIDIDRTAQTMTTSSLSLLVNTSSPLLSTSSPKPQAPVFRYVLSGRLSPLAHTLGNSSPRFAELPVETRIEVSPASWEIARAAGELIGGGGAGLVIDYGGDRAFGSSFRAFQKHKLVDVFHEPGLCDLTANVDFAYLKEAFESKPTTTHGPITQHAFLTKMGAPIRLHRLLQGAKDDETRERLRKGAIRLMDLLGMGGQYKVMGVTSGEKQEQVYPFAAQ